jgi:hypothetical protein
LRATKALRVLAGAHWPRTHGHPGRSAMLITGVEYRQTTLYSR